MLDNAFNSVSTMSAACLPRYAGPERRSRAAPGIEPCLKAILDEIDYGMLLLDVDARVIHVNHAARLAFAAGHPLQVIDRELCLNRVRHRCALDQAIAAAARHGLRRQLAMGEAPNRAVISIVPLNVPGCAAGVLVMLGKRPGCDALSIQGFAALHHLTTAETSVLRAMCEGASPAQIASRSGLALSTIRTQIASIRSKTDASTIREVLQSVTALPPMVGVLRGVPVVQGEGARFAS